MPKIAYITKRFNTASQVVVAQANRIITSYQAQGLIINDGRLAGYIDWDRPQVCHEAVAPQEIAHASG